MGTQSAVLLNKGWGWFDRYISMDEVFDPHQKVNQHFVPQFWLKRFAGQNGHIYKLSGSKVYQAGAKELMSSDWLYTTYDRRGMPSNRIEDVLGVFEGQAAQAMNRLGENIGDAGSLEDQLFLRWFIALTACRHPDVMGSGFRRGKELAYALADVHMMKPCAFERSMARFGMLPDQANHLYELLIPCSEDELLRQAEEIESLPPNDPILPSQLALDSETVERVLFLLGQHRVTILDATPGHYFLLGDTPLGVDLAKGFTVPLSSAMALLWEPGADEMFPNWCRRRATVAEIEESNQTQVDNAAEVVIGSCKTLLERYAK